MCFVLVCVCVCAQCSVRAYTSDRVFCRLARLCASLSRVRRWQPPAEVCCLLHRADSKWEVRIGIRTWKLLEGELQKVIKSGCTLERLSVYFSLLSVETSMAVQKPVLKTSQVGPNSLFTYLKERARCDLKRLKNQLLASANCMFQRVAGYKHTFPVGGCS